MESITTFIPSGVNVFASLLLLLIFIIIILLIKTFSAIKLFKKRKIIELP